MSNSTVDLYIVYKIIRALTTDFDKTAAFKLGLIDKDGKSLRKASTEEEKNAMTLFDKMIFNIKRLLNKIGAGGRVSTFAAALWMLKEGNHYDKHTDKTIIEGINANIRYLNERDIKTFSAMTEEIANVTGAAVAGTGDSGISWATHKYRVGMPGERRKHGRYINGVQYLRRLAKAKAKANGH